MKVFDTKTAQIREIFESVGSRISIYVCKIFGGSAPTQSSGTSTFQARRSCISIFPSVAQAPLSSRNGNRGKWANRWKRCNSTSPVPSSRTTRCRWPPSSSGTWWPTRNYPSRTYSSCRSSRTSGSASKSRHGLCERGAKGANSTGFMRTGSTTIDWIRFHHKWILKSVDFGIRLYLDIHFYV